MMSQGPIPDSYWVSPGELLAGEYPGSRSEDEARHKLRQLLSAKASFFLDLTEEGEYGLKPYDPLLREEADALGFSIEHRRMPIPDMHTPTLKEMKRILNTIDAALEAGHIVYVHCYGGIGRTGTVVGCHLVQHGMSGEEALREIARLRQDTPDGWKRSPETQAQREFVRSWRTTARCQ